jgi:diaminopimelate epimerase
MNRNYKRIVLLSSLILTSSCSLFGLQSEESPNYKVLIKEGAFEVREYSPYIVAETTVQGSYSDHSGNAFRILAGYIFGKNKAQQKVSMTSPVQVEQESMQIAMTSPVKMNQSSDSFTMRFSMPSKYQIDDLPKPVDNRIKFKKVNAKIIASHRFSWLSSKDKNDKKFSELKSWLKRHKQYRLSGNYSYAGYNPPWTLPFFRRNEVHIQLEMIK